MEQIQPIYTEEEVVTLEREYGNRVWLANLIEYSCFSILEDALAALIPMAALVEIGLLLHETVPQMYDDAVPIYKARQKFIEEVEELSEEQIEKRHAFFDAVEELLNDIPRKEWPMIALDDWLTDNAFYWGSGHVVVFSTQLIEEFEKGDDAVKFLIGHELGHCRLKHADQIVPLLIKKIAAVATTSALVGSFFSLQPAIWSGIAVGAFFNYALHKVSVNAEFEADAYAVEALKTAKGAKTLFAYFQSKYGSVYDRFIEQGFTEEQAMRLASACEQSSLTHPSAWARILHAEELAKKFKEREVVQLEEVA